jgi:hypothetical protein
LEERDESAYAWSSSFVALVGAVAVGAVLLLQPEPVTGDAEAGAACAAMTQTVRDEGSRPGRG